MRSSIRFRLPLSDNDAFRARPHAGRRWWMRSPHSDDPLFALQYVTKAKSGRTAGFVRRSLRISRSEGRSPSVLQELRDEPDHDQILFRPVPPEHQDGDNDHDRQPGGHSRAVCLIPCSTRYPRSRMAMPHRPRRITRSSISTQSSPWHASTAVSWG